MKIQCCNGLCDRLGMIFSYLQKVRQKGEKLTVCWINDDHCNGHFLDLFEPVPDVEFTEDETDVEVYGFRPCKEFLPWETFIYCDLRLLRNVKLEVDRMKTRMGHRYTAVHVRRTDKVNNRKNEKLPTKEMFFEFIDNRRENNIFLATDNRESQMVFKERYGDRLFLYDEIVPSENLRQTTLEMATIDMFTCVGANHFRGTGISGFTAMIHSLRSDLRKNIKLI